MKKALTTLLAAAILTIPTVAMAGTTYNEMEDNDSISTANSITVGSWGSPTHVNGSVGDDDYFKAYVSGGAIVYVDLTVPSGADFDVEIYNPSGTMIKRSQSVGGESFSFDANSSGNYYFKVYKFSGSGAYELQLQKAL